MHTNAAMLIVCRETFEADLREEIAAKIAARNALGYRDLGLEIETGLLRLSGAALPRFRADFASAFIFERQRLLDPIRIDPAPLKIMAREIIRLLLPPIVRADRPWTIHAFASNPNSDQPLTRRAGNLCQILLEFCQDRFPVVFRRYAPPAHLPAGQPFLVLQLCLTQTALWGCMMPGDQLSDPFPGGMHRMPFDPQAPSRSYLKIEEAFSLMGEAPRRGQRVVDLGAAPGGWSYAFLKRGARVLAVDHGPLKLKSFGEQNGQLTHRRENGLTFAPPADWRPVDWLVSDMLIPPGQTLGLLRRWLEAGWARRLIVTLKLPQQHPYPALAPLERYLREANVAACRIRHLYHDRREVTVMGRPLSN